MKNPTQRREGAEDAKTESGFAGGVWFTGTKAAAKNTEGTETRRHGGRGDFCSKGWFNTLCCCTLFVGTTRWVFLATWP